MASKLKDHFMVEFNVYPVDVLSAGDVVQYKSQNKYYRYLQFVESKEGNVELKGAYNTPVKIPVSGFDKAAKLKLKPVSPVNSSHVVNEVYYIQKVQIQKSNETYNNQLKEHQSLKTTSDDLFTAGLALFVLTCAFAILAGILVVLGYCSPHF